MKAGNALTMADIERARKWLADRCDHEIWMVFDTYPPMYSCSQCHVRGVKLADGRIVPDGFGPSIPDRFPDRQNGTPQKEAARMSTNDSQLSPDMARALALYDEAYAAGYAAGMAAARAEVPPIVPGMTVVWPDGSESKVVSVSTHKPSPWSKLENFNETQ